MASSRERLHQCLLLFVVWTGIPAFVAAAEVATTIGSASATVLNQPFAVDAPEWSNVLPFRSTEDELIENIVFNNLQSSDARERDNLRKRQEQTQVTFSFTGAPHTPLTISLNDIYREMKLASEVRSASVRMLDSTPGSVFLDGQGRRSVLLEVLLNRKRKSSQPYEAFAITVEHN